MRKWSNEEVQYLIDNAGVYPVEIIASRLGRSTASVANKAEVMGICIGYHIRNRRRHKWTSEDIELLSKLYIEGYELKQIADKMGMSLASVKGKIYSGGIAHEAYEISVKQKDIQGN